MVTADTKKQLANIIQPSNFVTYFSSRKEFEEWANMGTKQDIEKTIEAFEKEELYEHCIILRRCL
jgi:hypothetical protein